MAVMIEQRTLRGKPVNGSPGPSKGVLVKKGARIEVLGKEPPVFVEVRVLDEPDKPEGWVTQSAIDETAQEIPPIKGDELANVAVEHANTFG